MLTLAQIIVSQLRNHLEATAYQQAVPDPLFYGMLASLGLAAFFGWRRSGPIENLWQRGVIAVLAAFGALIIGFLAALADRLLGFAGLICWGAVAVGFGIASSRWATRGGGPAASGVA